jgi:hypothetical protein
VRVRVAANRLWGLFLPFPSTFKLTNPHPTARPPLGSEIRRLEPANSEGIGIASCANAPLHLASGMWYIASCFFYSTFSGVSRLGQLKNTTKTFLQKFHVETFFQQNRQKLRMSVFPRLFCFIAVSTNALIASSSSPSLLVLLLLLLASAQDHKAQGLLLMPTHNP